MSVLSRPADLSANLLEFSVVQRCGDVNLPILSEAAHEPGRRLPTATEISSPADRFRPFRPSAILRPSWSGLCPSGTSGDNGQDTCVLSHSADLSANCSSSQSSCGAATWRFSAVRACWARLTRVASHRCRRAYPSFEWNLRRLTLQFSLGGYQRRCTVNPVRSMSGYITYPRMRAPEINGWAGR